MLDRAALRVLQPAIGGMARKLVQLGLSADTITWFAFALGLAACVAVALGHFTLGLALMLLGRAADGLDGAVARLTQPTDRGAFLDIALDFLFYASFPLAFAIHAPEQRALPAAVLLAAFVGTGSSFLAFATLAAKRGMVNPSYPNKGLYFLGGLTEGTETIICFALMCLWPQAFAWWAYGFAALCCVTIATRLVAGATALKDD